MAKIKRTGVPKFLIHPVKKHMWFLKIVIFSFFLRQKWGSELSTSENGYCYLDLHYSRSEDRGQNLHVIAYSNVTKSAIS